MQRRDSAAAAVVDTDTEPAYKTDTRTNCATAILPDGAPARTPQEVMKVSKVDKQYGMGIQESDKRRPGALVNSSDYWEKRCESPCMSLS